MRFEKWKRALVLGAAAAAAESVPDTAESADVQKALTRATELAEKHITEIPPGSPRATVPRDEHGFPTGDWRKDPQTGKYVNPPPEGERDAGRPTGF